MLTLETAYISETGHRARNEDSWGCSTADEGDCWVVSDGAGGHGGGDKASQIVIATTLRVFRKAPQVEVEAAVNLLESAHQAVVSEKQAHPEGANMHATAALLLIDRERHCAVWGHVGDTRIYLFRDCRVAFQTRDHSLVQSMIDTGHGTPEMIRQHPQRSLLTAAIGSLGELELSVSGAPAELHHDDVFLICTDGWWEYVQEDDMELQLREANTLEEWLQRMANLVVERAGANSDNYTAVAIHVTVAAPARRPNAKG